MSQNKAMRCILALNVLKELNELMKEDENKKRRVESCVNPLLEIREPHNLEHNLLKDILWEDDIDSGNFCRLTVDKFEELLAMVDSKLRIRGTGMRYAVTSRVRLAITLRYIVNGDSYRSLEVMSNISRKTISKFMPEIMNAISKALQCEYLNTPTNQDEWLAIANDFDTLWDFPHTLGVVEGKHIQTKTPPKTGSDYYNSIALFAVVDAHSNFLYIEVAASERDPDVAVIQNSSLYDSLQSGQLNIPPPSPLRGLRLKTPFYFIGDEILGLGQHLMRAYDENANLSISQKIFNYRISRARLPAEMALGRLASRFRVFHRPLEIDIDNCVDLVRACCVLHNYLSTKRKRTDSADEINYTAQFHETITPLYVHDPSRYKIATEIRERLCKYCVTNGDVPLQWERTRKQNK